MELQNITDHVLLTTYNPEWILFEVLKCHYKHLSNILCKLLWMFCHGLWMRQMYVIGLLALMQEISRDGGTDVRLAETEL